MDYFEYVANLRKALDSINQKTFLNRIIVAPAAKLLAVIKNRIQRDGKDSMGKEIGDYSTTPMYATRDRFVKKSAFKPSQRAILQTPAKTPTGRKSKAKPKVKKVKNQTMYLIDGWRQLRDIQGMQTTKVDLTYSTSLMQNYQLGRKDNEVLLGFTSVLEGKKARGNEKHFNTIIFQGSEKEINEFKQDVFNAYSDFISKALKGIYGAGNISTD